MKTIEIEWLSDSTHCETCGSSYASGAYVSIDGILALELVPYAHCFNGKSWDTSEVYEAILGHLGYRVEYKE